MPDAVTGTTIDQPAAPADGQSQSPSDIEAVNAGFDELDKTITSIFNDLEGAP